jgi:hypothetical protein
MTGVGLALEATCDPEADTEPVVQEGGQGVASDVWVTPL